jgi:hypothetical protein
MKRLSQQLSCKVAPRANQLRQTITKITFCPLPKSELSGTLALYGSK